MVVLDKPSVGIGDALQQWDRGAPAKARKPRDIEQFARRTVWLARVTLDRADVTHRACNRVREFEDG